jgi:hypothetical protein
MWGLPVGLMPVTAMGFIMILLVHIYWSIEDYIINDLPSLLSLGVRDPLHE